MKSCLPLWCNGVVLEFQEWSGSDVEDRSSGDAFHFISALELFELGTNLCVRIAKVALTFGMSYVVDG